MSPCHHFGDVDLRASDSTEAPPELEEEIPLPSKSSRLLKTSNGHHESSIQTFVLGGGPEM